MSFAAKVLAQFEYLVCYQDLNNHKITSTFIKTASAFLVTQEIK